jgi:alpha-beta hydrolase superfamily lysophospholipase
MRQDAAAITVPVLIIAGANDRFFEQDAFRDEPMYYPRAASVEMTLYERTGHVLFHHRNHDEVDARAASWIGRFG